MKKYRGWWCAWCATWVDEKDTYVECEQRFHSDCRNVVDKRTSTMPIQTAPNKERLREQAEHRKMAREFMKVAM